jgi:DNA polymerase-3 subunit beta
MKFSASQSSLYSSLQSVAAIVPSKSPMPVLTHILVSVSGNTLTLTGTDLEVSMETQLEVKGLKDGRALLPARKLIELIQNFGDVVITVDASETGRIKVTDQEGKNYELQAETVANYPKIPSLENVDTFMFDRIRLERVVSKAMFAVSRDELRPQLTGAYLKIAPGELRLVTTDGHRLVKISEKTNGYTGEAKEAIVPSKAMTAVARMCGKGEGDVQILFAGNQLGFRVGHATLITKLIEGRYPNYEAVIPTENKNLLTVDLEQLQLAVRRAATVSNEISRQIRLKLKSEQMEILVEDVEQSNSGQEIVPCTYDGEPMDIGYNAAYVLDMLRQVDTNDVQFQLGTPTSAGIVRPTEQAKDEDLLMLIMPVRLN